MSKKSGNLRGTDETRARPSNDSAKSSSASSSASTSTTQSATPSLASRVQSSAAGLARSAFQGAASSDAAQTLTNATNGKAEGPSTPSSNTAVAVGASQDVSSSVRSSGAGQEHSRPAVAESFRSGDTAPSPHGGFALPSLTEDEFQREYSSIEAGNNEDGSGATKWSTESLQGETGTWKGKQRAQDPVQATYTTAWQRAHAPPSEKPQPQPTDGAAVVSLLSDTSFDPNFDPSTETLDLDPSSSPPPLTAAETDMLNSYRREIAPATSNPHQGQQLSSLSLVPDIDAFLQQNDPEALGKADGNTASTNITLRDSVLTHLPGAADWVDVQERYHDDVWGYLRPALEAAKEEIEEEKHGSEHEGDDGPAVRRLKMILRHMQKSSDGPL
ncbi:hypothetical protein N7492_001385 [Penicillium capsulatum]|uniref:Uncharacterized protein n=1 Tax=Penicillium capsulatum TaxID=69766 RepID=A0A9W9ITJ9_9EURO|nr:hypothetical protein N7492_001385 [Penicillium capsulatum]KAJ6129562.1 hypothetical protein N7512_002342 [Penicillium capsulatum]